MYPCTIIMLSQKELGYNYYNINPLMLIIYIIPELTY